MLFLYKNKQRNSPRQNRVTEVAGHRTKFFSPPDQLFTFSTFFSLDRMTPAKKTSSLLDAHLQTQQRQHWQLLQHVLRMKLNCEAELLETESNTVASFPDYRRKVTEMIKWWKEHYNEAYQVLVFELSDTERR